MKRIEKKKLSKLTLAIILAAILAVAVAASLIIYFTVGNSGDETEETEPPVALEGEDVLYNSMLIAYPTMEEADIQYIYVSNDEGSFGMVRPEADGSFTLYYYDENGKVKEYRPKISEIDDNFNYEDLFAIETGDGYNMVTKLTYLCMSLQTPYFEERIYLSDDAETRAAELDAYGLSEGEYTEIRFTYLEKSTNEDGEEISTAKSHSIKIGDATVLGTGYYFTVDDRDYVYAGISNYFDYALMGFYSFIKSVLVSPGLEEDSVISAYLTTNYYQWVNEMHDTEGDVVTDGSKVIAYTDTVVPVDKDGTENPASGYISDGYSKIEFDLSKYKDKETYARMLSALVGKSVGDYSENEIIFSLTSNTLALDFSAAETLGYTYSIVDIEAILTDGGELSADGVPVGDSSLVKLAYRLSINGEAASDTVLHAVLDLSSPALPADFVSKIRAASVGSVSEGSSIELHVNYTKDNSVKKNISYVVTEIVSIYDAKGAEIEKITSSSIVCYRYRFMVDGVLGDEEYVSTLNLGEDKSESGTAVKNALVGKGVSNKLSIVVREYTEYCEYFMDFITYKISRIDYFVTKSLVSAFRFQNPSERDPYFGDSLYENTMNNKYSIYGLNHSVCQEVVNILTGIAEATTSPEGLIGLQTVAVGITPSVMEKFGLYAHTIYFEIPRGLWAVDSGDANTLDDYDWYETLGFTLYISEEQEDGTRYVGSDLYDIVARVDGESFVFLKYDFVNFWARRDLMLTDIENITNVTFELYLEDMKGIYDMRLDHRTIYVGSDNKGYLRPPTDVSYTEFDEITVVVTPEGECTPTKLTEYIAEMGYDFVSLTELYNQLVGGGEDSFAAYDSLGTSNFKEFIETLYFTTYSGVVPKEEQAEILKNTPMVMRMSFKLNSSAWRYVYEFYRYDDRRVMVRLYQATYDPATNEYTPMTTPVSDFYVSTFAFKKLADHFIGVMNAEDIDRESAYE